MLRMLLKFFVLINSKIIVSGCVFSCFLIIRGDSRFLLSCWMMIIIIIVNSVLVGEFIKLIMIVGVVLRKGLI